MFDGNLPPLHEATFGTQGDLFHLERLWIYPKNRGNRLGLTSCAALLALFQTSCGFAAMRPFPLQWEGRVEENESQFQEHRQKLVAYYEPLGFVGVPDLKGFFFRPLEKTEPAFTYHLESKDALLPSLPWVVVPGSARTGNGAVLTVPDTRPRSSTNRFFRAVQMP